MTAVTPIRRDDTMWETSEAFRAGMRQLASGVSLITGGTSAAPVGLIATAVCSVSVEPPTLLASINHSASAFAAIDATGRFAVNVLGVDHRDVVEQFGRPERRGERFQSGEWVSRPDGPLLLGDAIAVFDCKVVERLRYSTHTIFLARPLEVSIGDGGPLIHFNRQFYNL
jgi:flavin reductase (DIM6/NTAB) family NADH-FMN oxidoreductase RutF